MILRQLWDHILRIWIEESKIMCKYDVGRNNFNMEQSAVKRHLEDFLFKEENKGVLILITRKGYWAYKVLFSIQQQKKVKKHGWKVYSDRYIMKCVDLREFENKRIWIYDDTMNNGKNLFYYYVYFRMKVKGAVVTPVAYACNASFPFEDTDEFLLSEYNKVRDSLPGQNAGSDSQNKIFQDMAQINSVKTIIGDFKNDLCKGTILVEEDIARIRKMEVDMFQRVLSPMVVDLPIASRMLINKEYTLPAYMHSNRKTRGIWRTPSTDFPFNSEEETVYEGRGIELSCAQFNALREPDENWEYIENIYQWNRTAVNASYFEFKWDYSLFKLGALVHDCIVKCEYRRLDNGNYCMVFVPFAIIRSMTFQDTLKYFFGLLGDTSYGKKIYNDITGWLGEKLPQDQLCDSMEVLNILKENHGLCVNMFRSVIFYLSDFIFLNFKDFLFKKTGIIVDYDWDFMEDSLDKSFIEGFKKPFNEGRFTGDRYLTKFAALPSPGRVFPVDVQESSVDQKINAEIDTMVPYIEKRLLEVKRTSGIQPRKRVYTLETIIADVDNVFMFHSQPEEKRLITRVIVSMLETSMFGNEIYIDNSQGIIYRGFRYGENSELLFIPGMEYFYAYVQAFYRLVGEDEYEQEYPVFVKKLERYFRTEHYMGVLIKENVFKFMVNYFGNIKKNKLEELIMNKQYALDSYWDEDDHSFRLFVIKAYKMVKMWNHGGKTDGRGAGENYYSDSLSLY